VILVNPNLRGRQNWLTLACIAVVVSIWIEKGLGMVVTGFVPSPLGHVTSYVPTIPEILITLGIYGFGALLITGFYKMTLSLRGELKT
jgi:molybdopterin-containing oxidoreductase family membrane subunit